LTRNRAGLIAFIVAALLGVGVFGMLAWRSVSVERASGTEAQSSFEDALAGIPSREPLVRRDAGGAFVRETGKGRAGPPATQLHVLAYHIEGQRLVRADVPLWFFKVKGPAVEYAVRGTGFDLEALGLTAGDLERAGPRVVLDEVRATGDRVLAWTD
jgi:hypothetical protein